MCTVLISLFLHRVQKKNWTASLLYALCDEVANNAKSNNINVEQFRLLHYFCDLDEIYRPVYTLVVKLDDY